MVTSSQGGGDDLYGGIGSDVWDEPSVREMIEVGGAGFREILSEVSYWWIGTIVALREHRLLDAPVWDPEAVREYVRQDQCPKMVATMTRVIAEKVLPIAGRRVTDETDSSLVLAAAMLWNLFATSTDSAKRDDQVLRALVQVEIARRFYQYPPSNNRQATMIAVSASMDLLISRAFAACMMRLGLLSSDEGEGVFG